MANPVPKPTKQNRPKLDAIEYADKPKLWLRSSDIYQNRELLAKKRRGPKS